jgi:hypothetical protein
MELNKKVGVIWLKSKGYESADGTSFRSMLDAYEYETKRILDMIIPNPDTQHGFKYGASSGILALDVGRGAVHDVYRAALQAAENQGYDVIWAYQDTQIAGMTGKYKGPDDVAGSLGQDV